MNSRPLILPPGDRLRKRRRRTAFTDEQLDRLEESFEVERFPGIQIREDLARELNIGEDRIQVGWLNYLFLLSFHGHKIGPDRLLILL